VLAHDTQRSEVCTLQREREGVHSGGWCMRHAGFGVWVERGGARLPQCIVGSAHKFVRKRTSLGKSRLLWLRWRPP
jgi:hypothetical protein